MLNVNLTIGIIAMTEIKNSTEIYSDNYDEVVPVVSIVLPSRTLHEPSIYSMDHFLTGPTLR